jgi:glyoxylase-like metal-dependent hydrolase (beta-lactamase superfamily II)
VRIGEYESLPVLDGEMRVSPTQAYRATTEADWAPHRDLLDAGGMLPLALGGFLVRGGAAGRLALIDVGLGHHEMFGSRPGGKLLESLAGYGVEPADVTDVLFSHLHFDHIGWASDAGGAIFPNAVYRCDQRDWDFWMESPPDSFTGAAARMAPLQRELLEPVRDRFVLWSADGPLLPGVDVLHTPGHTPGSAVVVVSSGTDRALLLGDAVHCPIELIESEWGGLGDVDPDLAKRTRIALAREIEGTDVPVAAAHFPGLQFGRLLSAEGRRRWVV